MVESQLFQFKKLNADGIVKANFIRAEFDHLLTSLAATCPPGREFAIVKTKLEEGCFFSIKAVSLADENQAPESGGS